MASPSGISSMETEGTPPPFEIPTALEIFPEEPGAAPVTNFGHSFVKKTFHRPTYCHNCADMLWGIMQQGSICEVCNFVIHDRCMRYLVTPCSVIATSMIKNPVAHCWTSELPIKRKFCNVCRKRWDNRNYSEFYCEICEYYAHSDCVELALANCKEIDLYVPGTDLSKVQYHHHWREGNLPPNTKCRVCRKNCWSSECLSGYRCEWCGICCHAACKNSIGDECNFGTLKPIFLPPHAVSVPRTKVPVSAIIGIPEGGSGGVSFKRKDKEASSCISGTATSSDGASGASFYESDADSAPAETPTASQETMAFCGQQHLHQQLIPPRDKYRDKGEDKDRDDETIIVYDGDASFRKGAPRCIIVSKLASLEHILGVALEVYHIDKRTAGSFQITDAYSSDEVVLANPSPIISLGRRVERPSVFIRLKEGGQGNMGKMRVYPGKLQTSKQCCVVNVDESTVVREVIRKAIADFGLEEGEEMDRDSSSYRLTEVVLDAAGVVQRMNSSRYMNCGTVMERVMDENEKPWLIMKEIGRESLHTMHSMRFYLQLKQDPHGTTVALFVGNLPKNISERNYENFLMELLDADCKFSKIGPIYYEFGSLVITFDNSKKAVAAFYKLKEEKYDNKPLLVMLLPSIEASMIPSGLKPLLIFVNAQSGGCQGQELITKFRKVLNPYQVFNLVNGGPLPGLYVFRHIKDYRILVCGGDGTVGWVLQCLDNVGQDSECSSPPCGIIPLGTGNDLARVLRWGPGWSGNGNILSLLRGVIEAEEIRLDRWTVVLYPDDSTDQTSTSCSNSGANTPASEEKSGVQVMNNYFGIGLDADLCLAFHNARKENPQKFQSRLGNKHMYFRMGLKKMLAPSGTSYEQLHRNLRIEVDNKLIDLPDLEGIIILNILSWGSGANPWGHDKDDQFATPNHYDGMLEVVGVSGVIHLGQIQSGLRTGIRIAQGGHIKIHLNVKTPVQIDGEPTKFGPGEIVILKSALKATMLKKSKSKNVAANAPGVSSAPPHIVVSSSAAPGEDPLNGEERKSIDEG